MENTLDKVDRVLRENLPGATTELELLAPLKKVSGFVYWDGFANDEQLVRQRKVWRILRKALTKKEQIKVSAILTLTHEESNLMRAG
jgi:hypothetical protein